MIEEKETWDLRLIAKIETNLVTLYDEKSMRIMCITYEEFSRLYGEELFQNLKKEKAVHINVCITQLNRDTFFGGTS